MVNDRPVLVIGRSFSITGGQRQRSRPQTIRVSGLFARGKVVLVDCTVAVISTRICLGLAVVGLAFSSAAARERASTPKVAASASLAEAAPTTVSPANRANFRRENATNTVRQVANWVVDSGDNHGLDFVILDKKSAEVFVFDARGQILGAAPALIGLAPGDDTAPGIGDRPLSRIRPDERTTPAGRFVASLGPDLGKFNVLWVDYAAAISLHRVVTSNPRERRLQRLATPTPLDNRISFGCINVPRKFFDLVVQAAFAGTKGIVYVLPDIKTMRDVFPTYYDPDEHPQMPGLTLPVPTP